MRKWNEAFDLIDHGFYYALQPFVLMSVFVGMWMGEKTLILTLLIAAAVNMLAMVTFPLVQKGNSSLRYVFVGGVFALSLGFGWYFGTTIFWKIILMIYLSASVMRALSAGREVRGLSREFYEALGVLCGALILLLCIRVLTTGERRGFEEMLKLYLFLAPIHLIRANLTEAYGRDSDTVGREKNLLLLNCLSVVLMAVIGLVAVGLRYGWAGIRDGFGGVFAFLKKMVETVLMFVGYGAQWLYYALKGLFEGKESLFQESEGSGGTMNYADFEAQVYESHVAAEIIEVIAILTVAAVVCLILFFIGRRMLGFFLSDSRDAKNETEERHFIYREREKSGLVKRVQEWLRRENLSPTRQAYKKQVEALLKQGLTFKKADTPLTFLKKAPGEPGFADLTEAYQKERYGKTQ